MEAMIWSSTKLLLIFLFFHDRVFAAIVCLEKGQNLVKWISRKLESYVSVYCSFRAICSDREDDVIIETVASFSSFNDRIFVAAVCWENWENFGKWTSKIVVLCLSFMQITDYCSLSAVFFDRDKDVIIETVADFFITRWQGICGRGVSGKIGNFWKVNFGKIGALYFALLQPLMQRQVCNSQNCFWFFHHSMAWYSESSLFVTKKEKCKIVNFKKMGVLCFSFIQFIYFLFWPQCYSLWERWWWCDHQNCF